MSKLKYQRLEVVYPAGTTAGEKSDHQITLDNTMKNCVAVAMYPIADGGIDPVRIGVRDLSGVVQEPTHQNDYIDNGFGDFYGRKKPMGIPAEGNKITLVVDIPEVLASDLKFDFVFILQNED